MVEVSAEVWESAAGWLELTGLARTLWRLREPKPVSRTFATRNIRHTASALERLRSAGFVKEAVVGDVSYVYLTERTCGLLLLLGYSPEGLACGEVALRFIRRGASSAFCRASPW
ncbi:hypothetical protein [Infirmifilum sp. NZ]|uniref:hypothetical protein n=1 Tax=Infirmifilum sp. NZ TaxID=2926850 RepID=UPI0027A11875|nr:hypothetical protein [Infirmifilum sp. NZ]UNQ73608.1 hypothetical protein MOV14_00995 [Infirmifilum sp. NZ]